MSTLSSRTDVTSWGRVVRARHDVARPTWRDEVGGAIAMGSADGQSCLAIGNRRSYGESGLNPDNVLVDMTRLDRVIAFDRERRLVKAEAGLRFHMLLPLLVREGFFVPVTPGTQYLTLGGAVANDVHGKNHHAAGTFGRFVRGLGLRRSDGTEHVLTPADTTGLFAATIGGLGLTGAITWVEFAVIPIAGAMIEAETVPFGDLASFFAIAAESEAAFDYTVAWVDCLAKGQALGRGVFSRGRHAPTGSRLMRKAGFAPSVPVDFPEFALGGATMRAFNAAYFWNGRRKAGRATLPLIPFFYPLDGIQNWNRIYGRRGMYQYQSVVPPDVAPDAVRAMLTTISAAGQGSFLAVLKTFGALPSPGLLSFPMPGTTLALDFPNLGRDTLHLLDRLDAIVREARGRLYPAKDGRMPPDLFHAGYPNLETFASFVDPAFSSLFWRRMWPLAGD